MPPSTLRRPGFPCPEPFSVSPALVVAVLVGLSFAPAASATRYDFDVTKTVRGYTIHVVGWIDVDRQGETITGHIHITVSDATGRVLFEKDIDFTVRWSSTPSPIRFIVPAARLLVTISFTGMWLDVTAVPLLNPTPAEIRRARFHLVE